MNTQGFTDTIQIFDNGRIFRSYNYLREHELESPPTDNMRWITGLESRLRWELQGIVISAKSFDGY
jgi:hypothetical protein